MNRKDRMKPWELKAEQNKPRGFWAVFWFKLKRAIIWIGAAIAAAFDFIFSLF